MRSRGRTLLQTFQKTARLQPKAAHLTVGHPPVALLRPVATDPQSVNPTDVRLLTAWRNKFVTSFLTEFNATSEQTTGWLTNVVGPDDTRILFMIDDLTGRTFGYMGLAF